MLRLTGPLAALFSFTLAALISRQLQHERYKGYIEQVTNKDFIVQILEGPEHQSEDWTVRGIYGGPLPQPPSTMKGRLVGTQMSKFVVLTIPAPAAVLGHVVRNADAEISHIYLDLPVLGPVVGATSYIIGSYEWREPLWPVYRLAGLVCLAPILLWVLAALVVAFTNTKRRPLPIP